MMFEGLNLEASAGDALSLAHVQFYSGVPNLTLLFPPKVVCQLIGNQNIVT
jgi:hypothetical protein